MKYFISAICILFLAVTLFDAVSKSLSESFPDPPAPVVIKTAEENARAEQQQREANNKAAAEAAKKAEEDDIIKIGAGFVYLIKQNMRNPDSFRLKNISIMDTHAYCITYRAQNGFGGMDGGGAVLAPDYQQYKIDGMDGFDRLWNKYCGEKTGRDITNRYNLRSDKDEKVKGF